MVKINSGPPDHTAEWLIRVGRHLLKREYRRERVGHAQPLSAEARPGEPIARA